MNTQYDEQSPLEGDLSGKTSLKSLKGLREANTRTQWVMPCSPEQHDPARTMDFKNSIRKPSPTVAAVGLSKEAQS